MKLDVLRGTVEEIIFQNEANGYTVCSVCCERILHTVVGCLPDITPGETLNLTGKWTSHSEYGEQFKVEYYERVMPSTQSAILAYLSSGIIKGIRAATALKIVERFGCETLDVIANQPGRLAEIKGISKTKAAEISAAYVEKQSVQSIVMFLQKYGVSSDMAVKVHKTLGPGAIDMITKDPYVLCEFISGISFKTSDRIAKVMGLSKSHFGRIRSGIKFVLQNAGQSGGHTFLPRAELCRACCGLLEVPAVEVENQLVALCVSGAVVEQDGCCYLKNYFEAETGVCQQLLSLARSEGECDEKAVLEGILQTEQEAGITLSAEQRQAVQSAAGGGVLVITGGPGTGKTTIINAIIRIFQNQKQDVALCAPTGRAAKRMTQMCGVEAKTCHRLLEVGYGGEEEGAGQFARDAQNPLDAKAVIVDEVSMVDIFLMHSLLKALKPQTKLILVGDSNQLPSVGPGNVLKDIIASGAVKGLPPHGNLPPGGKVDDCGKCP